MTPRRKLALAGVALLLVTSLTTACAVSLGSGIAGIIVTIALGGLLFGLGGASSGCSDSGTKADAGVDQKVGPCLGAPQPDGSTGPCLSPPAPDLGPDGPTGPCLSPQPDLGPDGPTGPCLGAPQPDLGPDGPIGPCLSLPPKDASAQLTPDADAQAAPVDSRRELLARHSAALPDDVLARLRGNAGSDRDA